MGRDTRRFRTQMKSGQSRILMLVRHYLTLVVLFILEKPLFMLYAAGPDQHYGLKQWLQVMWHGIPIDLSVAGYLTLLPVLLVIVSVWAGSFPVKKIMRVYDAFIGLLLSLIFAGDAALYPFWGFKLDASVLFYLKTPKEAMASISPLMVAVGILAVLLIGWLFYRMLASALKPMNVRYPKVLMPAAVTVADVLLFAPLFLAIRGGVSESTMNVGHAYFSDSQFLNHAAVNPGFSLLSSVSKTSDYSKWYDYFDESRRSELADGLYCVSDTTFDRLLNQERPNVLIMVMEGFGGRFVNHISGTSGITPCFDSLVSQGVFFSNCYAGSFRTDRGLVCVMNGHPGLPVTSIMKLPNKSASLPSIPGKLVEQGYKADFMYGGDANFTNMRSWLFSSGFSRVVSDADFTLQERHTNAWGVNDDITMARLLENVTSHKDSLWMTGYLSLSSHEPFEVPFSRFEDPVANSFAYTDSCLGWFVDSLRRTPAWDSLLLVITPDHGFRYPASLPQNSPEIFHIPVLWLGGAVSEPRVIDCNMCQSDIAATLLAQLGIGHDDFRFSRNVLSSDYSYPFSFYTFPNGFCYIDSTGFTLFDDDGGQVLMEEGEGTDLRMNRGKAILQTLHDDLESR